MNYNELYLVSDFLHLMAQKSEIENKLQNFSQIDSNETISSFLKSLANADELNNTNKDTKNKDNKDNKDNSNKLNDTHISSVGADDITIVSTLNETKDDFDEKNYEHIELPAELQYHSILNTLPSMSVKKSNIEYAKDLDWEKYQNNDTIQQEIKKEVDATGLPERDK